MAKFRRSVGFAIGLVSLGGFIGLPGRSPAQPPAPAKSPVAPRLDLHGDPLPPGALVRLGTIKYRQDSPIYRIAFTADGKHFVTDGEDSTLRVWDAATGRVVRRIDPGVGALEDFGITRRGDLVMAVGVSVVPGRGAAQNVTTTHIGSGTIEDRGGWSDEKLRIDPIVICPDRRLVAIGTEPSGVRIVDAWNGAEVCRFDTGGAKVSRLLFSKDGRRLAVETRRSIPMSVDWGLRVFDLDRRQEIRVIGDRGNFYSHIVFSPNASAIVATGAQELPLWVVATGERVRLDAPAPGNVVATFLNNADFSADGRVMAGVDVSGAVCVYDMTSRQRTSSWSTRTRDVDELALSPDGRTLVAVGRGNTLHAWDLETRRDRFAVAGAYDGAIRVLLPAPDAKTIVTGGEDATVRQWDLGSGKPLRLERLSGPVKAAAIAPDGGHLVAATSSFHQVFSWDLRQPRAPDVLNYATGLDLRTPLALRCDEHPTILLVDDNGRLHRLDMKERRVTSGVAFHRPPADLDPIEAMLPSFSTGLFLPGREEVALMGRSGLHVVGTETGKERLHLPEGQQLAASPDGRILAVASRDSVRIESVRRMDVGQRYRTGFRPIADGGEIRLIDLESGRETRRITVEGSEAWGITFSPDGRRLAVSSGLDEGEIHIYEVATGREVRKFATPATRSSALVYMLDGKRLAGATADGSVLVWDVGGAP